VSGTSRLGAASVIVFALTGLVEFALELAPQVYGFADTDSPAVSLQYLHEHPYIYAWAGVILLVMAISLVIGALHLSDVLRPGATALAVRSTTVFGLLAAASFFGHGVLRLGVGPLLYIDGLDPDWGEAAYLVVQIVGIHGFAQAAITALCVWAIGVSLIGLRTRVVPTLVCALGIIPAIRLLGILGPLGALDALPDVAWILFMLSIPGVYLWCLILGIAVLRRGRVALTHRATATA